MSALPAPSPASFLGQSPSFESTAMGRQDVSNAINMASPFTVGGSGGGGALTLPMVIGLAAIVVVMALK